MNDQQSEINQYQVDSSLLLQPDNIITEWD